MKYMALVCLLVTAVLLIGCKKELNKATLYTENAKQVRVIDDSVTLEALVDSWESKQIALEKLLPLFKYKVKLELDGKVQTWSFNTDGYLMQEGETQLYKTPKTEVLKKIIQ